MDVVKTFGGFIDRTLADDPARARWIMKTGWEAMGLKMRLAPEKGLASANRYLAHMMMDAMVAPLRKPNDSAIVSIFLPCELLQEVGLNPYNVEGFSCYASASGVGEGCVRCAELNGAAETLCSYHKTFVGAAERGLMPRPRCIAYTNVSCDANMLTFDKLSKLFSVPLFFIDVPFAQNESSVKYVEKELRDFAVFLENLTGKRIDDDALSARLQRSKDTMDGYVTALELAADRHIPEDLVSPLYCAMANNIMLGTKEEERFVSLLLDDAMSAPKKRGKHIYWMHTIPYRSDAVYELLAMRDDAQIVGCELGEAASLGFDPARPYEAMARRLVCNRFNGSALRRIELGIESAKRTRADGVVWFNHWGCKHTIGASQLAKRMFEEAGIPMLVLDGDGVDSRNGGEGQTSTRLGAFLEMLG